MRKKPQSGFIKLLNRDFSKHSTTLACCITYGQGVEEDEKEAAKCFAKLQNKDIP